MSGCASTHRTIRRRYGASAYPLCPPNFSGRTLPVRLQRVSNRLTELMLTPQRSAVSWYVWPVSIACTMPCRRSSEYGFPIHAGPLSSGKLESQTAIRGNPHLIELSLLRRQFPVSRSFKTFAAICGDLVFEETLSYNAVLTSTTRMQSHPAAGRQGAGGRLKR